MSNREKECVLCTNPKLPNSDYCEGCQSKKDTYTKDEKDNEEENLKGDE